MKKITFGVVLFVTLTIAWPSFGGPLISRQPINIPASESSIGIVKLATDAGSIAGTDTASCLTPANLRSVILDDMADATLSGAPVVLGIKDKDGNTNYFKAYPTKN